MKYSVLIIRTFPDILNINTYNVQEIGLAKALTCHGIECGIVLFHGRKKDKKELYRFQRDKKEYSFPIYWLGGFGIFKNGFMPSVYKVIKNYDVIQVHEYDQIFSWMFYSRMKQPTVVYHGPYYHDYAKGYNLKCNVFDNIFLRNKKYPNVVVMTKSELASDFIKTKGFQKIHTVGVGIDSDKFNSEPGEIIECRLDKDDTQFRLLYVGKIEERRNMQFLIELFKSLVEKVSNIQLVIVGNGEREYVNEFLEKIQGWVEKNKIIYIPKATQKELSLIYQNSNMFVFTSNYEIFGMVLLEAMYFGLPVISSMNGGASVLIKNNENGYVMDGFNVDAWEKEIIGLSQNKKKCIQMGENAHYTIENHFLWDKLTGKFMAAYEEAISEFQINGERCNG